MKNDHVAILLEDIDSKLQATAEAVSGLNSETREIKKSLAELPEIKNDISAIKSTIKDQTIENRNIRGQQEEVLHQLDLSGSNSRKSWLVLPPPTLPNLNP